MGGEGDGKKERTSVGGEGEYTLPCMPDHKGHFLRRDIFGCDDEVAFVFAVGGVEDDDEFAVFEGADGVWDAVEVELRGSIGWHLRAAVMLV